MKNKFIIGILLSSFLLIPFNARAAKFTDNQTVDTNKVWTIKFTGNVDLSDLTKQGITITHSNGNIENVDISLGEDNKTVIVTAPQGGYTPGESYILNIGNKVHSSNGKVLKTEYKIHFNIKNSDTIVNFKDKNLEQLIRKEINKPNGDIYKSDVEKITILDAYNKEIQDISGIENLTNLQEFNLSYNEANDIGLLKGLNNLKILELYNTKITDISPLKDLTNLQEIDLGVNEIVDISALSNLTNLKWVNLSDTKVTDISALKGLVNLKTLALENTKVSDVSPLSGLTNNLQYLHLDDTQVSDISPLKGLINLKLLDLYCVKISDADKQSLKNTLPKCNIIY